MTQHTVFMAGLPDAGKTTFIAALWHLIFSKTADTLLRFDTVEGIDTQHLTDLRNEWLKAKKPARTKFAMERTAVLKLKNAAGDKLALSLDDLAGEGFRRMWTARRASAKVSNIARSADRFLLFVNVANIQLPRTTAELKATSGGESMGKPTPFDAKRAPTAVQVTDILQQLMRAPISARPSKIAVGLTAWDEVSADGLSPQELMVERMPLLNQYLQGLGKRVEIKLFGLSAQGGSYEVDEERKRVLDTIDPSDRILIVDDEGSSRDLTRMLSWLLD